MDRILVPLIGIPIAFALMIYRVKLKELIGNIPFAEKYLGAGGTYTFFVLLGLGVFIFSCMYMFGTFQDIFSATLGKLFV
jgi:hypothetical protein